MLKLPGNSICHRCHHLLTVLVILCSGLTTTTNCDCPVSNGSDCTALLHSCYSTPNLATCGPAHILNTYHASKTPLSANNSCCLATAPQRARASAKDTAVTQHSSTAHAHQTHIPSSLEPRITISHSRPVPAIPYTQRTPRYIAVLPLHAMLQPATITKPTHTTAWQLRTPRHASTHKALAVASHVVGQQPRPAALPAVQAQLQHTTHRKPSRQCQLLRCHHMPEKLNPKH